MARKHASSTGARFDVIVIGAGAAGMMCAAVAGRRGRRVLLIEHYDKLGEKIRISGGGRCNFTNLRAQPANYLSQNPEFCRSALSRFTPSDFIELVESYRIAWHEKALGQLFCDRSSLDIILLLKSECDRAGVHWRMPCAVQGVGHNGSAFAVSTSLGPVRGEALVIATGGLTVPKIGATPFGYRIAEQFGIPVVPPRPALVPLAFDPAGLSRYGDLSGIAIDAEVSCNDGKFRDALLFTHRGLSGPAILQISSYWNGGDALSIDLLPDCDAQAWLERERRSPARLDNVLARRLPRRFAQQWSAAHGAALPINEIDVKRRKSLVDLLHAWPVLPSGTLGYNKAEVTLGGVDTRALSSRTMGAVNVPRLHFIGEVVDVTGWLGGYNFQWAWSSGYAAGEHA